MVTSAITDIATDPEFDQLGLAGADRAPGQRAAVGRPDRLFSLDGSVADDQLTRDSCLVMRKSGHVERILTDAELSEWAEWDRADVAHAQEWFAMAESRYDDATDGARLTGDETRVQRAISYAISWVEAFDGADYPAVAKWCPYFSTTGSYDAAAFARAGWGEDDLRRSAAEAGAFDHLHMSPEEAEPWVKAGMNGARAFLHVAAGFSLAESLKEKPSDTALRSIAALKNPGWDQP